jgi:hypothetical protein
MKRPLDLLKRTCEGRLLNEDEEEEIADGTFGADKLASPVKLRANGLEVM